MFEPNNRRAIETELLGRQQPPVAGDHGSVGVDQHRHRPAKLDDAGREPRHLLVGMGARVAGVGLQSCERPMLDREIW